MISPSNILGDVVDTLKDKLFGHHKMMILRSPPDVSETHYLCDGLVVTVALDLTFHGYTTDGNNQSHDERRTSCTQHYLFYGGTAVWMAETGLLEDDRRSRWHQVKPDEWQFLGSHDSCWRGRARDGIGSRWLKMRDEVLQDLTEEERSTYLHKINDHSRLGGTFAEPFDLVRVRLKPDRTLDRGYHPYSITNIERVDFTPTWA